MMATDNHSHPLPRTAGPHAGRYSPRDSFVSVGGQFISGRYTGRGVHEDLLPGIVLGGRFVIAKRVGDGAFSSVHAAEDKVRGELVALKIVELGPNAPKEALQLVRRELAALAKVTDFQHVIRMHDVHIAHLGGTDLLLLSMELADGGDFRNWLSTNAENCALRQAQGPELLAQVCQGVATLHHAGALHLDLKPENLLFVNGVLKVGDLGSASLIHRVRLATGLAPERNPDRPGTPAYMAPERFTASYPDELGPQADIYSLGIIAFETLSEKCRPPFAVSDERLSELHRLAPLPPLQEVAEPVARVIFRCLQKDPSQRYARVEDMLVELKGGDNGTKTTPRDQPTADTSEAEMHIASRLYAERDLNSAKLVCQRILDATPTYFEAAKMLADIQLRSDLAARYYVQVRSELGRRRLPDLLDLVRKAVEIYPNHPDGPLVQDDLRLKINEYRDCIQGAAESLGKAQLEEALLYFTRSRELNPGSARVARNIENLRHAIGNVSNPDENSGAEGRRRDLRRGGR